MAKKLLNRGILFFGMISVLFVSALFLFIQKTSMAEQQEILGLTPYFSYTAEDVKIIESLNSDKVMSEKEINQWIQAAFNAVKSNIKDAEASRVYTYLFLAHRDAAALSLKAKKKLMGSLAPVSRETLCHVLPKKCSMFPKIADTDPYSQKVAEIVSSKVKMRLKKEKEVLDAAPKRIPPADWDQHKAYFGSNFGNQMPWLLNAGNQFRLKAPKAYEKNEIQRQKKELENILASITQTQVDSAKKWAAGRGTILTSGQWIDRANRYMAQKQTPLEKEILIRSILSMGLSDATIAYYDSKYTHWKKRPPYLFPELKSTIKTPSSPSYPSGHATLSMAAAIIMDHFFPENKNEWDKQAKEIGESRLWGGVHFPIDDYDGLELGQKIGRWIISKIEK